MENISWNVSSLFNSGWCQNITPFSGWTRCGKRTNVSIKVSLENRWHLSVANIQRNRNISYDSVTNMWHSSHRNISRKICYVSKFGSEQKRSYVLAPTRIENRITVSTNISQLLFLLERFVEIADMSWRIFRALKILQPLQCLSNCCAACPSCKGCGQTTQSLSNWYRPTPIP